VNIYKTLLYYNKISTYSFNVATNVNIVARMHDSLIRSTQPGGLFVPSADVVVAAIDI